MWHSTLWLLATLAALSAGPWLHAALQRRVPAYDRLADRLLPWVVTALAVADVVRLAHDGELAGPVLAALAGWAVPGAVEQAFRRRTSDVHLLTLAVAMVGLLAHGFADGALIRADFGGAQLLPAAIALHSLPVGVAIWWLIAPHFGRASAALAVAAVCLSTLAGFASGASLHDHAGDGLWRLIEAFVAGSLVHVAFGKPHLEHAH